MVLHVFAFLRAPHDAAYYLLTHHWQVHEKILPPYLAYIRRNCLGMDVNNLESILVQVMTCHRQTAYSYKLKQRLSKIYWTPVQRSWLFGYFIILPPPHHLSAIYMYMHRSINWVSIDSGNGFPPVWRQAITWISADLIKSPQYNGGDFMFLYRLSHPGIPGVTLCFCTFSYASGCRFLFTW